jgi:hypothetical protein
VEDGDEFAAAAATTSAAARTRRRGEDIVWMAAALCRRRAPENVKARLCDEDYVSPRKSAHASHAQCNVTAFIVRGRQRRRFASDPLIVPPGEY